jgi:hypothetical protein
MDTVVTVNPTNNNDGATASLVNNNRMDTVVTVNPTNNNDGATASLVNNNRTFDADDSTSSASAVSIMTQENSIAASNHFGTSVTSNFMDDNAPIVATDSFVSELPATVALPSPNSGNSTTNLTTTGSTNSALDNFATTTTFTSSSNTTTFPDGNNNTDNTVMLHHRQPEEESITTPPPDNNNAGNTAVIMSHHHQPEEEITTTPLPDNNNADNTAMIHQIHHNQPEQDRIGKRNVNHTFETGEFDCVEDQNHVWKYQRDPDDSEDEYDNNYAPVNAVAANDDGLLHATTNNNDLVHPAAPAPAPNDPTIHPSIEIGGHDTIEQAPTTNDAVNAPSIQINHDVYDPTTTVYFDTFVVPPSETLPNIPDIAPTETPPNVPTIAPSGTPPSNVPIIVPYPHSPDLLQPQDARIAMMPNSPSLDDDASSMDLTIGTQQQLRRSKRRFNTTTSPNVNEADESRNNNPAKNARLSIPPRKPPRQSNRKIGKKKK